MKYIKPFLENTNVGIDLEHEFQAIIDTITTEYGTGLCSIDKENNKIKFDLGIETLLSDNLSALDSFIKKQKIKLEILNDAKHIIERLKGDGYNVSFAYTHDGYLKVGIIPTNIKITDVLKVNYSDAGHGLVIDENKLLIFLRQLGIIATSILARDEYNNDKQCIVGDVTIGLKEDTEVSAEALEQFKEEVGSITTVSHFDEEIHLVDFISNIDYEQQYSYIKISLEDIYLILN